MKKNNFKYWYVFAFLISSLLMLLYKYPEALDIIRTFERAEQDAIIYTSLFNYTQDVFQSRIDFIYYDFLYICLKLGIPLGLATTFVLFAYFVLLIKISTMHINAKMNILLTIGILVAVPTVTVISVSRNTFAFVFMLMGLYCYFNNKKYYAINLVLVALFSHFSILIFLSLFCVAVILSRQKFLYKYRVAFLFGIIAVGFTIPTLINEQLLNIVYSYLGGTHYVTYESFNDTAVLKAPQLSNGDKLYFVYTFIMLIFLTIKDENRNEMYWFMFLLCFLDAFYFNSSIQMSLRLTILTPVCIGYSLNSLYNHNTIGKRALRYISLSMMLVTLIYYYSNRSVFFVI